MIPKKKKTKKKGGGALFPPNTRGGGRFFLFFFLSSSSSFILSNDSRKKTVVNFRKRGEHPLARGEESRISGADVCVARAVEQFRCAFFLRGRAQGRKKDTGIARCRRLIF